MTFPTFTTGEVLTAADMNAVGLWLVKTQTVGSAVSTVTVTGAFSSDYENYRIIYFGGSGSGFGNLLMTLGSTATGYYWGRTAVAYSGAAVTGAGGSNDTSWSIGTIQNSPNFTLLSIDIFAPQLSVATFFQVPVRASGVGGAAGSGGGFLDNTTSYTAFTLATSANTMTGGTIRVYGYRN
jgi:hypothetical protein